MDFEKVKLWFEQHKKEKVASFRWKGFLGLVCCPIVSFVAATIIYALLRLFIIKFGYFDYSQRCLWIALVCIPLMFIGNRFSSPGESLMEKRMREGAPIRSASSRNEVMSHLFLWIMFTGPRLGSWGAGELRNAKNWQAFDIHSCAAILCLLISRPKKISYEEIHQEIPWLELPSILPQITQVYGVMQLESPPPGLSLMDDLRKAIRTGASAE